MFTKIKSEIKQNGISHFIKLKVTEQFYKYKFKKLRVNYVQDLTTLASLNSVAINKDSKINQASPYYELKKAFALTGLKNSAVRLLDIGCGSGRALNFGMLLNFDKVYGIDLDKAATEKSINNCIQMQKKGFKTFFEIFQSDASDFTIPEGINIIYLFNPFGQKTMESVARNILNYHKNQARELFIIYSVPVHQEIFKRYKNCIKIYERFGGTKTKSEMVIFKVNY